MSAKNPSSGVSNTNWKPGVRQASSLRSGKPKSMRIAGLLLLASSPFLAYVFLLPGEEAADVAPETPRIATSPTPSLTPSTFPAFVVPDLQLEPLNSHPSTSSTGKPRPRRPVVAAAQPTPETNGTPGTPGPAGDPGQPAPVDTETLPPVDPPPKKSTPACEVGDPGFPTCSSSATSRSSTPSPEIATD